MFHQHGYAITLTQNSSYGTNNLLRFILEKDFSHWNVLLLWENTKYHPHILLHYHFHSLFLELTLTILSILATNL